jgi:quinoprotein glucose dehydrogenase
MGPDGRLYFSIGDRGFNVRTPEWHRLAFPDTGAVLRCEPDGSNLEVFATGLRNPQHLAFDEYGNLFTADNNSDSGDKARLVFVVEGGDSGWRIGYQYGSSMSDRGPWNAERLWHLRHAEQPAYILPPIAHIADGPSGLCYNPGLTALPDRYVGHFFLCDFRGDPAQSGVRSFAVKPQGATFGMDDAHQFVWSLLATDCNFGPDGGLYVSDWVFGWEGTGKGRIYRVVDPAKRKTRALQEVRSLLAEGFENRPVDGLLRLLEHADMRIRQEAQFALAAKNGEDAKHAAVQLIGIASNSKHRLARVHAMWALGQMSRRKDLSLRDTITASLRSFLGDPDAEIRAQAVRTMADANVTAPAELVTLLADAEPRVRMRAGLSLSRVGRSLSDNDRRRALTAICAMLNQNADRDAYVRHAGVMALSALATADDLALLNQNSPAVHLGILLALRRQASPTIRTFLSDPDPRFVAEAARAIHDVPIPAALPDLAALLEKPGCYDDSVLYRALNAHFRLGLAENATAVAEFAARAGRTTPLRLEALRMLGDWTKPGRRDRVTGATQDLGNRDPDLGKQALERRFADLVRGADAVRQETVRLAGRLGLKAAGAELFAFLADRKISAATRVQVVEALDSLNDSRVPEAISLALRDPDSAVRNAGRGVLARRQPEMAVPELAHALESGSIEEQQAALKLLGDSPVPAVSSILSGWLDRLLKGKVPEEIQLELLEAAARRNSTDIRAGLARWQASRKKDSPIASFRESLRGGNARTGREIFFNKTEVACLRCHKVNGKGGEVGPDLTGIGAKQSRDYLLESIVDPNRQITKGYETVVLGLRNGTFVSGVLKEENAREIRIITPETQLLVVPKDEIEDRQTGKSAMPEDIIKHLTKHELRDLVEFLAGLK